MKKNTATVKVNRLISYIMVAVIMIGLVACDNNTEHAEDTSNTSVVTDNDNIKEDNTVSTVIDAADVIENENGEIVDAVSHTKLSDAEIEEKIEKGILNRDKNGNITINQNKNTRKVAVTIDSKTNEILTAEGNDGKSYKIDDGKISAPKNSGTIKVEVEKNNNGNKTEVTVSTTESKIETTTERKVVEVTTESVAKEEPKTEAPKKEEPKTEAPKKEEPKTEAPKKEEPKTEAPKKEEPKTEAPKKEEPKTEAPKKEEPKTEAPKKEEPKTEAPPCSHTWVWKTHTETVHHSEEYLVSEPWDEPVYENHSFCNGCGTDLTATYGGATTDAASIHLSECGTGYHSGNVQVGSIHHDAEYATDEWDTYEEVKDYQYCSKCGERK